MTAFGTEPRRLGRLLSLDADRRALLVEAAALLVLARAALLLVPFAGLARRLGAFVTPTDPRVRAAGAPSTEAEAALARRVGWAVASAARNVPFQAVCLPRALAARHMLNRRGVASALHFGAAKGTGQPLDAHAWLDAAGVGVTGFPVPKRFVELGCFI